MDTPDTPVDASDVPDALATPAAAVALPAPALELFGSFVLGGDEFALPAVCIREVVHFPERITVLPLAPHYLEGMFTLRGTVIPVVNLGRLFRPEAGAAEAGSKIAIIDYQHVLVGILFDDMGEILRVRPEQRSELHYANDGHGVIAGTILLDGGARLLQILDPERLIRIENVPQVLALKAANRRQNLRALGSKRQAVSFHAGGALFGLEIGAIQEIIAVPALQTSILNSRLCLGRIDFRGLPIAIVDFAALLNPDAPRRDVADGTAAPDGRIVVARIGEATIGFLVDDVNSIVHFYDEDVLPIPLLSKARAGMFGGCIARGELGDVILLDHHGIFSNEEIIEMRNGHARLYPEEGKIAAALGQRDPRKMQRQVYVTFTVERAYALEMRQLREIIEFSSNVSRPPGTPPTMRGMLNLRQQMIGVIDLRRLFGMAPIAETEQTRILIIDRGAELYGLLVDCVDGIVTAPDSARYGAPKLMRNGSAGADMQAAMAEVIDLEQADGSRQTYSVFSCDRLLAQLAEQAPEAAA